MAPGLEGFGQAEMEKRFGPDVSVSPAVKPGNIPFTYTGDLRQLLSLRMVGSVFVVRTFDIPRPLALLGHQHLESLLRLIETVRSLHPPNSFHKLRMSAAGERSPVFERLRQEIGRRTGLAPSLEEGDLLVRVRRPLGGGEGFEVSVRLSPRPLSARPWRVCDMPGALNATVARAMVELTRPRPDDVFLNMAAGSATIMIERMDHGPAREILGAEINADSLRCARANLLASGFASRARLEAWDATRLPLADASVTAVCADLPFGHLLGSHAENERLYPLLLLEAARLAVPGARLVLLTSEMRLLERALARQRDLWMIERTVAAELSGVRLRIYALLRSDPSEQAFDKRCAVPKNHPIRRGEQPPTPSTLQYGHTEWTSPRDRARNQCISGCSPTAADAAPTE